MTRKLGGWSLVGVALAAACLLGYADWALHAREQSLAGRSPLDSSLLLAGSFVADRGAIGLFHAVRIVLAVAAVVCCGLGALILIRAGDNLPARVAAWLLVGYAALTFVLHFGGIDPRYGFPGRERVEGIATVVMITWLAMLAARFLVVFPRVVDGDSVMGSFWARRRRAHAAMAGAAPASSWAVLRDALDDPSARSVVLLPWHRCLVDGRMVWLGPLAIVAVFAAGAWLKAAIAWDGWGGVWFTVGVTVVGWYLLFGLPFAFASPSHLFRNGNDEERRRVSWLRAVILGLAVLLALAIAMAIGASFANWTRWRSSLTLQLAGAFLLFVVLIPTLFVMGLAFAVLYGGALDPRIAVTRFTLWSILGLGVTVTFLLLERYVAVKLVGWLSLPPDSGAIFAGAVIAGTFVPVRRVTERAVTRLADRYLPISVVADGVRVVKTVMVSDLSGYTALSATDEPRALLLGALLKRQAERIVAAHGGTLVKSMGDAVMTTFASSDAAVCAALDLHRGFPGAAEAVGVDPLPLHTALHRGEIVESHDGDIFGQTVNVTARLVDAAAVHEIVLSGAVRGDLGIAVAIADAGSRRFKNVPEPVACFRIDAGGEVSASSPAPPSRGQAGRR